MLEDAFVRQDFHALLYGVRFARHVDDQAFAANPADASGETGHGREFETFCVK